MAATRKRGGTCAAASRPSDGWIQPAGRAQYLPGLVGRGDWRNVRALNRRATVTTLAFSIAAAIALVTIAEVFASPSNKIPVIVAAMFLPAISIVALRREILRSIGHVWPAYLLADVLTPCLAIAAGLGILRELDTTPSAEGLLFATGLSFSVIAVATGRPYPRQRPTPPDLRDPPDARGGRLGTRSAGPFRDYRTYNGVFANRHHHRRLLRKCTERCASRRSEYARSSVASIFLIAVASVFAPRMAERWSGADRASVAELHRDATRMSFWPTAIVAVPILIAPDIPLGLFGPTFADAATPLRILVTAQLLSAATGPVGYLMIVTGAQNLVLKVFGLAAVIDLVGQILLTPTLRTDRGGDRQCRSHCRVERSANDRRTTPIPCSPLRRRLRNLVLRPRRTVAPHTRP